MSILHLTLITLGFFCQKTTYLNIYSYSNLAIKNLVLFFRLSGFYNKLTFDPIFSYDSILEQFYPGY